MLRTNHFPRLVSTLNLHYALEWVQGWWIWAHVTYTECGPQKWVALPFESCSCLAWLWDDVKIAYAWFQERQSWLPRELRFSSQELCAEFITRWPLFWLHTDLAVHWLLRVSPAMLSSLPRSASLNPEPLHSSASPLLPACCSCVLQAAPTGMHSEKFISVVPHFHKMVVLLAVITDGIFSCNTFI